MTEEKKLQSGKPVRLNLYDIMDADAKKWRDEKQKIKDGITNQSVNRMQELKLYKIKYNTDQGEAEITTNVKIQSLELKLYNECLQYIKHISDEKTVISYVSEEDWNEAETFNEQIELADEENKEIKKEITAIDKELGVEKDNVFLRELNRRKSEKLKRFNELTKLKRKLEAKVYEIEEHKTINELAKKIEADRKQVTENKEIIKKLIIKKNEKSEYIKKIDKEKKNNVLSEIEAIKTKIDEIRETNRKINGEITKHEKDVLVIKNRWAEKEDKLLSYDSDLQEAWMSVLSEAFTKALSKYEAAAFDKLTKDKPFVFWFRNEIPNAKERIGLFGDTLVVEKKDDKYQYLSNKAKTYLSNICEERNIKDYTIPDDILTEGFFKKQLEKIGIPPIEAEYIAEDIFSLQNVSLDSEEDDVEPVWIRDSIENENYKQEKEDKDASDEIKWILMQVFNEVEKDKNKGKLKSSMYDYIKYRLTVQLYVEALIHKIEYKKMIDEEFLIKLIASREDALKEIEKAKPVESNEDETKFKRYLKKPYEVLAEMKGITNEYARTKLKSAEKELVHYYNLVLEK